MKTGGTASTRIRLRETRALCGPEDCLPVIGSLLKASSAETGPRNEPCTPSFGLSADPPSVGGRSLRNEEVQIPTHHDRGGNGDLGLWLHFLSEKPDNRLKCTRSLFPGPLVNRSGNGARPDMRKHRGKQIRRNDLDLVGEP